MTGTVEIDRIALKRLVGNTQLLTGMDGVQTYSADVSALQAAEEALD